MLMTSIQNAILFTISTVFNIYTTLVIFRFLLQLVRADFYNPLAQFAVRATNPLLIPLRKIIPGYAKIDFASIMLALLLQLTEVYLTLVVQGFGIAANVVSISGFIIWGCGELIDLTLAFLFFAVLIQVVSSWLAPQQYNPAMDALNRITAPLFRPIHRILPSIGGIDMSPIVVIFAISIMRMVIADPIVAIGRGLI